MMEEKNGRHKNYKQIWIWEKGKLALSNEKVERENIKSNSNDMRSWKWAQWPYAEVQMKEVESASKKKG